MARFSAELEVDGEILARVSLYQALFSIGEIAEAARHVAAVSRLAEKAGDPYSLSRARMLEASHLIRTSSDFERALAILRSGELSVIASGDYPVHREYLSLLGNVLIDLGQYEEANETFQRLVDISRSNEDFFAAANGRYGVVRSAVLTLAESPTQEKAAETLSLASDALRTARQAKHLSVEAKAHWVLGTLGASPVSEEHFLRCDMSAPTARDRSYCLAGLARRLVSRDPGAARGVLDRALALSEAAGDAYSKAFAWREQMRVSWALAPADQAIQDSWAALETIEALRDLQAGAGEVQAGLFSTWADDYNWFAGRLLEEAQTRGDGERAALVAEAFRVSERLRARTLIDALEASDAAPELGEETAPLRERRAETAEAIARVQRRLLDPALAAEEREASLARLERLELDLAEAEAELRRADPAFAALHRPDFAELAAVQAALAPREALLAFQVAPWEDLAGDFGGGAWLVVVTRESARAYRLPGRQTVRRAVELFDGLFEARDGSEAAAAARLYEMLLAPAMAELPAGVERLIILPDDALYRLPFAALRDAEDGAGGLPLGVRFELVEAPSATLWLRWRSERPASPGRGALVFADPLLAPPGSGEPGEAQLAANQPAPVPAPIPAGLRAAAVLSQGLELGPLPHARSEGRRVRRALGAGGRLLVGDEASEAFVKSAALGGFGILHFAAHAVADDRHPARSAVVLAPGDADEDGLLQSREIAALDLGGRPVVLAACRSASGKVYRGEGVMSLARAFFQGGAGAVVASLWPLRDDEAEALFAALYDRLARGEDLAAALRGAQRERFEAGAPAAAWAGLVVLGDGGLVPRPGGRGLLERTAEYWWVAGLLALVLAILAVYRIRRQGVLVG